MCLPASRELDVLEARPVDAGTLRRLAALTAAPRTDRDAFRYAALWGRAISWAQAQHILAEAECSECLGADLSLVAQELALHEHVSFGTMRNELALVAQVAATLGHTWVALQKGEITPAHLKELAKVTRNCPPRVAKYVEERLIPVAVEKEWTPPELKQAAERAVKQADPDGAAERAAAAKKRSDVRLFPEPDDMATLEVTGPASTLVQVRDRLDARAKQLKAAGDPRNLGALRVHALGEAVIGADTGEWPTVHADIVLDLPTQLGLTRNPGELVGYGPITAETARDLAQDAAMRRLVTDPIEGVVIDVGRRRYRPTKRQRDIVNAVHRTCSMPGCARPSIHCDQDHRIDFGEDGRTSTCNLHPLCRRHHNLKTKRYWRIDQLLDGTEVWTSPLGFTYRKRHPIYPDGLIQALDDEPPDEVADRLPETDPSWAADLDGVPLPNPPPLTDEEIQDFAWAIDSLDAFGSTFREYANACYDEARAVGLID